MIHPAIGLGIKKLSFSVGLIKEPETKMMVIPNPRAKPGINPRRDLGKGLCEAHKDFEIF